MFYHYLFATAEFLAKTWIIRKKTAASPICKGKGCNLVIGAKQIRAGYMRIGVYSLH